MFMPTFYLEWFGPEMSENTMWHFFCRYSVVVKTWRWSWRWLFSRVSLGTMTGRGLLLEFSLQFNGRGSRTPLSMSKFGWCHASRQPRWNLPSMTQCPKVPGRCKKRTFSFRISKILGCHAKFRLVSKCRISKTGHASQPLSIWTKKSSTFILNNGCIDLRAAFHTPRRDCMVNAEL
jgi:hypothetical protein